MTRLIRCAITERKRLGSGEEAQKSLLVQCARRWAEQGVDFIQLREKDLSAVDLEMLARAMLAEIRAVGSGTKLLVNSSADVAVAVGADGVHLTSDPNGISVVTVRKLYAEAGLPQPVVSSSCHTLAEVDRAVVQRVSFLLFGPVFGKHVEGGATLPAVGLQQLCEACEAAGRVPVLALGGVTEENTALCLKAGAKGIAAIRLFAGES